MFGGMSTPTLIAGHNSAHQRDGIGKNGFSNQAVGLRPSLARFLLGVVQVRASAAVEADPGRDRRIASGPHSRTISLVNQFDRQNVPALQNRQLLPLAA
jgi:hypothetical protein